MKYLAILPIVLLFACCNSENAGPGEASRLELEKKSVVLSAKMDSVTLNIKANSAWWLFSILSVIGKDTTYYKSFKVGDRIVDGGWFYINAEQKNSISIRVNANENPKERNISIGIQATNAFKYLNVKQLGCCLE